MGFDVLTIITVFIVYMLLMLGIGFIFYRRNNTISDYILGGRSLNPWVTAMSAQASDMSGWLLTGLPGLAYISIAGSKEAIWVAIGLGVGTYLNWLFVAKPLRAYTEVANNSLTIPDYLENRFCDKSGFMRVVSAFIILFFFLLYTSSMFVASGKLFSNVFGLDYLLAMVIGAIIIISYTFLGGFLAVSWTDLFQGILMFFAIITVPIIAVLSFSKGQADKFAELSTATLSLFPDGGTDSVGWITIISSLAWGLGYFGMPHILVRFMAVKHSSYIRPARFIAMIWVIISMAAAVSIGIIGQAFFTEPLAESETVFMEMVKTLFNPVIAGILLSAILAAIMSTADSQLLVTASAFSSDIYKRIIRKNASEHELLWVSRVAVLVVSFIAILLAINPQSSIFKLVSYAWAGFGAAFGPIILFSLFWKRTTRIGAIGGIITGGLGTVVFKALSSLGGIFAIYEIVPAFILSCIVIVTISLLDKQPESKILEEFEKVKVHKC